jgi:hypothetical protein
MLPAAVQVAKMATPVPSGMNPKTGAQLLDSVNAAEVEPAAVALLLESMVMTICR